MKLLCFISFLLAPLFYVLELTLPCAIAAVFFIVSACAVGVDIFKHIDGGDIPRQWRGGI